MPRTRLPRRTRRLRALRQRSLSTRSGAKRPAAGGSTRSSIWPIRSPPMPMPIAMLARTRRSFYAAQVKQIIDGLDADALATAAQYLQGLDGVAAEFVSAAIQTAQAAQQLASAAQIAADAADYDAKDATGARPGHVNTIVAIRKGNRRDGGALPLRPGDPTALANAQINAALQGRDSATLAKTAAALQGIDTAARRVNADVRARTNDRRRGPGRTGRDRGASNQDAAQAQRTPPQQDGAGTDAANAQEQGARRRARRSRTPRRPEHQGLCREAEERDQCRHFSPTDRPAAARAQYCRHGAGAGRQPQRCSGASPRTPMP